MIEARKKIWDQFKNSDLTILPEIDLNNMDDTFIQKVFGYIRSNMANQMLSVEDLSKEVGFSRSQLHRKLKALINKSATENNY